MSLPVRRCLARQFDLDRLLEHRQRVFELHISALL